MESSSDSVRPFPQGYLRSVWIPSPYSYLLVVTSGNLSTRATSRVKSRRVSTTSTRTTSSLKTSTRTNSSLETVATHDEEHESRNPLTLFSTSDAQRSLEDIFSQLGTVGLTRRSLGIREVVRLRWMLSYHRDVCASLTFLPGLGGGRNDGFDSTGAATASLPPATHQTECKRLSHLFATNKYAT